MSALSQLIEELCPDGVEYATLGDVGEFLRGRRFTKADYVDSGLGSIHYGEVYTAYGTSAREVRSFVRPELKTKLRLARRGDLVIAATGESVDEVGKAVAWLGDDEVAVHDDCYIFRHGLDPEFVAYFFQSSSFHEQKSRFVTESKLARISGAGLSKIRIPVPPVDVQRTVVDILSNMEQLEAELEAELQAELSARQRQYEHYKNTLLTHERGGEVPWVPLSDLLREPLANGRSAPSGAGYPVLRLTALRGSTVDASQHKLGAWTTEAGRRFRIEAGDMLVVRGNGSKNLIARGSMVLKTEEVAFPDTAIRVRPNLDLISQRYLYYIWESPVSRSQIQQVAKMTSGVWKVSQSDLAGVVLPVPPLEEQVRIVSTLDDLDALVNDLTAGLATEVAARRKQYQHYRDLLLTFPEKKIAA